MEGSAGPFVFGPAMVRSFLAQIEGRFEEARAHAQRAEEILRELGMDGFLAAAGQGTGAIEMAAGDYPEAVRQFRHSYDELGRLGEHAFRSTSAAMLADALYQDGRPEEAEQMALASEEESAAEDAINFAIGRGVRARIRADRGESVNFAGSTGCLSKSIGDFDEFAAFVNRSCDRRLPQHAGDRRRAEPVCRGAGRRQNLYSRTGPCWQKTPQRRFRNISSTVSRISVILVPTRSCCSVI